MFENGPEWVLGMMSGTSLDGVDAAMVLTDGRQVFEFGPSSYRPYSSGERALLRAALGSWDAPAAAALTVTAHAELAGEFPEAALIGFHGQTLNHAPENGRTYQAGDGAELAARLGKPVVWDFRTADVALGGQGAPLAPVYHAALAARIGATGPVAFLNLGGVGNVTWVDPRAADLDTGTGLLAFDTGPANAPMDDLYAAQGSGSFDAGGQLAASGRVDPGIFEDFQKHPYFSRMPPKSLDRDAFAGVVAAVQHLSLPDGLATLSECAAWTVGAAAKHFPHPDDQLILCGGGRKNTDLAARIAHYVAPPVAPAEDVGLNGDMIEAECFAFLAARVWQGMATSFPTTTGGVAAVGGGIKSRP